MLNVKEWSVKVAIDENLKTLLSGCLFFSPLQIFMCQQLLICVLRGLSACILDKIGNED